MRISDWSSDVCSSDLPRSQKVATITSGGQKDRFVPFPDLFWHLRVRRLIPRASFCSGDLPNKLESQMRIYVDAAIHRWRGKLWCHMFSPNIDDNIGQSSCREKVW